jgi:UDP-glucose 4-epimerase
LAYLGPVRVLTTGGAGFVGSHVVERLLDDGFHVGVVDDLSTGTLGNLHRLAAKGLRDADVCIQDICSPHVLVWLVDWRPDVVVHLAAQANVARSVADPTHDARVNIVGTLNVLDAAVRAGVRKVVFASSGGVIYGERPPGATHTTETDPYRPLCPYGLAKATVNRYLSLYNGLFGLTYTALALGNVYGPRQGSGGSSGAVAEFVAALRDGRPPVIYGDGGQRRDFVYVTDVAEAFSLACKKADGAVLNIGTGTATSINEVLALVGEAMGVPAEPIRLPERPGEVRHNALEVRRAGDVLGWRSRVGLREGVRRVVDDLACRPRLADRV